MRSINKHPFELAASRIRGQPLMLFKAFANGNSNDLSRVIALMLGGIAMCCQRISLLPHPYLAANLQKREPRDIIRQPGIRAGRFKSTT